MRTACRDRVLTLNPPRLPVCDMSRLRIMAAERRRPSEIRPAGYLILIELLDKSRWAEATFTESPPVSESLSVTSQTPPKNKNSLGAVVPVEFYFFWGGVT